MEKDTIHTADDLYQEIADFRPESSASTEERLEQQDTSVRSEEAKGDVEEFLKELTALSQKYGIIIAGCGCDGSPWLETMNPFETLLTNLSYDEVRGRYR